MNNEFNNNNNNMEQENTEQVFTGEVVSEINKKGKHKKMNKKKILRYSAVAMAFVLVSGVTFQGARIVTNKVANRIELVAEKANKEKLEKATKEADASTGKGEIEAVKTTNNSGVIVSDVSGVVENVMPSIVSIDCTVTQEKTVFGNTYSQPVQGSGSGFIIGQNDKEVLIATNNHVVEGATNVEITFNDKTKAKATVKGTDATADLAVVAVETKSLSDDTKLKIKIATLGDSKEVKTGELAIAIGNALGYGQSVTVGYISALEREVAVEDSTMTLLQTDAAINPGNSGGALLNAKGEVIGINSVKYASEEIESVGYAIPISNAIPIIGELMNKETIPESEQAYLGITGKTVTAEDSARIGLPMGVFIGEVTNNSPAEKAGLQAGDIITAIDGKGIKETSDLESALKGYRANDEIVIKARVGSDNSYRSEQFKVTLGSKSVANSNSNPNMNSNS